jgi:hypothetical protein
MARSPIPQLIEDFNNMTPEERACFLDLVDPQPDKPEPEKKPVKRGRKAGKSRAPIAVAAGTAATDTYCAYRVEDGGPCDECSNNRIHDKSAGYSGYHEFVAAKAASGG